VIGEAFEHAQAGKTSFLENQRMYLDRNGYLEETFFTFSFSPIRDESGGVGGLFHPVTETTARMLTERRARALRDLAARAADTKTTDEACRSIIASLATCELDVPFALLYLFDADGRATLAASCGIEAGTAACPPGFELDDPLAENPWPVATALNSGRRAIVDDLRERFGNLSCGPYPEPVQKAAVIPVPAVGAGRRAGVLIAGLSTRLPFDEAYAGFLDLLAGHIGTVVANAQAHWEERRRAEALAELDRAKTAFFSNVSHEFRTPLTLMLAPLEELLVAAGVPKSAQTEIARVHRNGLRLLKLVNTLLDFSRIEAGRAEAVYEPTDLSHLTVDLASVFRSATEHAGLALQVDCPPLGEPVFVDHGMWEKVVLNLLSNAFKFTFEGTITVTLRIKDGHVELEVRDTGTGIRASDLPRVFDRFHRIQGARSRTHEGTGIGLALVQELAHMHGGSASVASELGVGTVFTISIPRGKSHLPAGRIQVDRHFASPSTGARPYIEEALRWLPEEVENSIAPLAAAPSSPDSALSEVQPRPEAGVILLADDNSDMRDYLFRILVERYIVHAVRDGQEALEFARRSPVDLVLSDVMMPRMDGFELLKQLRSGIRTKAIPVILLSARTGEESRVEGLEAGADDYLVKPFTVKELLARVESNLRMSRIRRESAALHDSELRFRTMADCAPLMLWTCDPSRRCDYFNRGWLAFTGHNLEEEISSDWTALIHSHDRPGFVSRFDAAAEHRLRFEMELRLQRGDGQHRWVSGAGAPLFLPDGAFLGYVFSCVDVDDRKRAQQALADREEQLDLALAATSQGLWDWHLLTGHCYFSPRYHQILGYEAGELPARFTTWTNLLHPDDRSLAADDRPENLRLLNGEFTRECRLRQKGGEYIWIQSKGKVTEWTADRIPARLVGTITDITQRRRLDEQFYQSQRLDSIGRLAAGVAHDFNNLLTVINGYAAMLLTDLAHVDVAVDGLNEIRAAGERAAALTQQLLAFSRKQILKIAAIDLNDVVKDVHKMLRRLIGEDIKIVLELAPDLGNIIADAGQIQQIVMNLAVNSRDAMPNGGTLLIETSNAFLDETYISKHPGIRSGHHVMMAVSDTGAGMTAEVQEKLFEPFYTTKPKGHGTGLGLSTVYGIVKQSGGWIWVYSEVGKGATFKLYFPRTDEEPAAPVRSAVSNLDGAAVILVVEDQDDVRSLAVKALQRYGHTVLSAKDATDAIRTCTEYPGRIDLMLTDVVMPGLTGRELAIEVARIRPETRVLFMSGYTDNAIAHRGVLDPDVEYIPKPFTPEGLARRVRAVLATRPPAQ
jgi:PAS domain S-box-containing protein